MVLLKNSLGWLFFFPLPSLLFVFHAKSRPTVSGKKRFKVVGEMLLTATLILQPYNCGSDLIKNTKLKWTTSLHVFSCLVPNLNTQIVEDIDELLECKIVMYSFLLFFSMCAVAK